VGWWALCITILAVFTAFIAVLFGYFFYWTLDARFLREAQHGPGVAGPAAAAAIVAGSWAATVVARRANAADRARAFYGAMAAAVACAGLGLVALVRTVTAGDLDPTTSAYAATVWLLVVWCAVHVGLGIVMHLYCAARRWAGRMTARHDIDISNVTLFWHFTVVTVLLAMAVVAGFPAAGGIG
jgi:cytochrome c oxidase subunit I+III